MNDCILEVKNISKGFPGVKALDNIHLTVKKGSVHVVMGENGAGKSTLMNILIGIYKPDSGEIYFDGKKIELKNPADALNLGISMIHQELNPVLERSVAENLWLGREACKGIFHFIDKKALLEKTNSVLKELEIDIDPEMKMKELTVAKIQLVEIAKAISYHSKVIIMDEPTSAITEKEVAHLFKMIKRLKSQGVSIIYISHKMKEIFNIADSISIFRDGKFIKEVEAKDITEAELIKMMVGRELNYTFQKIESMREITKLEVKDFSSSPKFSGINFSVRRGEIFGIAGLVGAGRTELAETIFGIRTKTSGTLYIDGKKANIKAPRDAMRYKIGFLTEDRKATGIFPMLSIIDNVCMAFLDHYVKRGWLLDGKKIRHDATELCKKLAIKTPNMQKRIEDLSGGNQQKALLARWLLTSPDILILDEPTRGIDIGAKTEIYSLMGNLAKKGTAIIMISSELPEILGMCDRIMVMHLGKQKGTLDKGEANQERILNLAYS